MDRYDRQKPAEELTDTERFSLELKRFKRENERLRMENDFLKKLEEIARMSRT